MVVDASVAVKWLMPEALGEKADQLLKKGRQLFAPDILSAEVASALLKKVRRKELAPDEAGRVLDDFRAYPIETVSNEALLGSAFSAALEAGISLYDALYLALSYERDCSLITADRRLFDRIKAAYPQSETVWLGDFNA